MISVIYKMSILIIIILFLDIIDNILLNNKQKNILKITNINTSIQKNRFLKKIEVLLSYLNHNNMKIINCLKPIVIIIFSFFLAIFSYIISYKYLEVFSSALIISVYAFFIPYTVLNILYDNFRKRIMSTFPIYIISLKNYTQISNDIIIAMKKVKAEEPLSIFIDKFNLLIEKGVNVYDAFEILKYEINIKKISQFITAIQNCYLNGGDFTKLLEKYSKIINNINMQSEKEKQDNFSSILVLVILIIINIFLIVSFVYSDDNYKTAITMNIVGKIILNVNILSYLLVFYFVKKIYRMEE